jgi:hypothetical protein
MKTVVNVVVNGGGKLVRGEEVVVDGGLRWR